MKQPSLTRVLLCRVYHDYWVAVLVGVAVVVALELEGDQAVPRIRELIGATNPVEARPGTIRAMYGKSLQNNAVHGSDSPESAEKELEIAFAGA